ncbi:MAG TPA: hypothetical protein DCP71_13185 [Verrucomicrobiales bacterium]|nr:hypothetical protein [Verrucomicrobiales bacterium]
MIRTSAGDKEKSSVLLARPRRSAAFPGPALTQGPRSGIILADMRLRLSISMPILPIIIGAPSGQE